VAFEIAQQLHAQGQQVALLAMLDHGPGNVRAPLTPGTPRWLMYFLRNLGYWFRDDFFQSSPGEIGRRLRLHVRGYLRRYSRSTAIETDAASQGAGVLDRMFDLDRLPEQYRNFLKGHSRALRNYVPTKYPGRVTLLRARTRPLFRLHEQDMGWRKLAQGGVDIRVVPGSHKNILKEPYVRGLAQVLRTCLDQAHGVRLPESKQTPISPSTAASADALLP
jgi:thioesterase domain-containing protein